MICQVMLVPPPAVRPSVKHDAQQRSEDDLSHILVNIIKTPEKYEYLKHVSDVNYKHKFFKLLYTKKNNQIKKKKEIANESVREYLKLYASKFNFFFCCNVIARCLCRCNHWVGLKTVRFSNFVLRGLSLSSKEYCGRRSVTSRRDVNLA